MKVMVIVKANADSEANVMPTEQELAEMGNYNEELVKQGIMVDGGGLHASATGARVQFSSTGDSTVVPGPFANPETLIAGYWIWEIDSLESAIEWAQRAPFKGGELEVRRLFSEEDFGEAMTDDLKAQEARMREQVEAQHGTRPNG